MPQNRDELRAKAKMANRPKQQSFHSPSITELRCKFTRIVSHHDQLKIAFHQLKCQIETGLLEAEDVFRSLAIPLAKLVGLKSSEMAEEGRSSRIFTNYGPRAQSCWGKEVRTESPASDPYVTERAYRTRKFEEDCTTRATIAGQELMQKQKIQLTQLLHLLKNIETQVNSSQCHISQNIADHQASMQKFFQKATTYISHVHQSGQIHDAFAVTLRILKATFSRVFDILGSVDSNVDDLMHKLATIMCNPMVEHVKCLKTEITSGTFPQMLAIMEEMRGAIKDRRLELEEATEKVIVAEEWKVEALRRLEESEGRVRKMKLQIGLLCDSENSSLEHYIEQKFLCSEEDQTKDEMLLWEHLKKKRKYQPPDSPFGPTALQCIATTNKQSKSTRGRSSINCRPKARSCVQGFSPQTPHSGYLIPLGSTPSATAQKCLSRKRVTP